MLPPHATFFLGAGNSRAWSRRRARGRAKEREREGGSASWWCRRGLAARERDSRLRAFFHQSAVAAADRVRLPLSVVVVVTRSLRNGTSTCTNQPTDHCCASSTVDSEPPPPKLRERRIARRSEAMIPSTMTKTLLSGTSTCSRYVRLAIGGKSLRWQHYCVTFTPSRVSRAQSR